MLRKESIRNLILSMAAVILAGTAWAGTECPPVDPCYPTGEDTQTYSYFFNSLDTIDPVDPDTKMYIPPASDEMRITFLGSAVPLMRRAQQMMSILVEVGDAKGKGDSFIFDVGPGVGSNYGAMGIPFTRMNKIFIAHLHGDHMGDLTYNYCFGPSADRKCPIYVWGPGPSGVKDPVTKETWNDGTKEFCKDFRKAMRWHTESFSFQTTSYKSYPVPTKSSWGLPCEPKPVGNDAANDAYAIIPIELSLKEYWKGNNVAYNNLETGVKITYFPVIHCRKGSIGYKLEWNGLTMIYTSDTKPEFLSVQEAINGGKGVDVFIHEMAVPAEVWGFKNIGLDAPLPYDNPNTPWWDDTVDQMKMVQNSSHTPPGAFGYLLSLIEPKPRLTVATHFPTADDTVACALNSVKQHVPTVVVDKNNGNFVWSFDLMVLKVFANDPTRRIEQYRAEVNDYGFSPVFELPTDQNVPKYHDASKKGDPYAQIDTRTAIPQEDKDGNCNYREDGY